MKIVMGTLCENVCTFKVIFHWIVYRIRNLSDKICRPNQNTHIMFNNFSPKIIPFMG